jgi:flagellar basal-body rod protein FlgB
MNLAATQQSHLRLSPMQANLAGGAIVYRVPLNPSVDNNTVEMGVEQAKFGRAAAEYQASLQFLENRISGLRKAIRGD